ncbi:hypothetical protein Vi05172_g2683 [Venturia inaequalis]|nr:hypothetical protein Vi05172_g2683 [Venturia inaequalis]
MASSAAAPSEFVKLIAYVDELEGGPPPVTLTILAKPRWRIHRIQPALVMEYERHLSKNYPELAGAYTVTQYDAFPPKTQFDETDHVSDILERPKGLLGPHIHILATVKEIEEKEPAITASKASSPVAETNDGSRTCILTGSAVENLRKRNSTQKEQSAPPSSGTLKRPTKTASIGGASSKRKNAPRRDLYEVGDDNEIESGYEDELSHSGLKSKRARTDAGPSREAQTPGHQIPSATPTSAQPRPPTVQSTPAIASSRNTSRSANPDEAGLARGLWTDRENELMLAEIIENGNDTPTAILRDTLFPGRTTEGIRKRRKKMQNDQAQEILRGRRGIGLSTVKTPASSKAPANLKGSASKAATSSKTPPKPKVSAASGTPAISKTPANLKAPIKFKTPARAKIPARSKSATPRSVPHGPRDSSPVVLIEVVDDPSQTQLEIRPGGAVRVKTPQSSLPTPLKTASTTSRELAPSGSTASAGLVPVSSENTPSHDSGFDELVAEEEQRQDSIEWLPQTDPKFKTPKPYSKFLRDARAAATGSDHCAAGSQLDQNMSNATLQANELASSVPIIPSSPSPKFTPTNTAKRVPFERFAAPKKSTKAALADSEDPILSSPDEIRSPSPETAAAWVEVERSSSKAARSSPGWPEDTPITKSAIANAEAREAVLTARITSAAVQSSLIEPQDPSHTDQVQSFELDEAEDFDTRKSGQTPRTLDFKARTPRSLTRSIASRRLPFQKRDTSSGESDSDCSDEDDTESSADEKDEATDIDEKAEVDANMKVDVNMDADSDSDASGDDNDSSSEERDVVIDVTATDIDINMDLDAAHVDVVSEAQTDVNMETDVASKVAANGVDVKDDAYADSDSSSSSSDSDSSEDENGADIQLKADSRVDAKTLRPELNMTVGTDSNFDSAADESDADLDIDPDIKANTKPEVDAKTQAEAKPEVDTLVGADMNKDSDSDSDVSDNKSDSSDSSDSENDDTEVGVRRHVSKALRALVDIDANSDVSSVSSHESDADSPSSDESSNAGKDEQDVEISITGSEADELADQQLRSDAEESQRSHDDAFANVSFQGLTATTEQNQQEKAPETSDDSDSDAGGDKFNREKISSEDEDGEDEVLYAPIAIAQPVKQKKTPHPQSKADGGGIVSSKETLKKNTTIPVPTMETQWRPKPAQKARKTKQAESLKHDVSTTAPTIETQPQARSAQKGKKVTKSKGTTQVGPSKKSPTGLDPAIKNQPQAEPAEEESRTKKRDNLDKQLRRKLRSLMRDEH